MTPDRLIRVITGSLGEQKTSFRLLSEERDKFMEAMARATETREPQKVKVGGKEFVIKDPGRAGREIEPA